MEKIITTYCDINEISDFKKWLNYAENIKGKESFSKIHCWNTDDFLALGIWRLMKKQITDGEFFQIGDITSNAKLKQPRPFLQALEVLVDGVEDDALYVLDEAAKVAFLHKHGQDKYDSLMQKIQKTKSAIVFVP